MEVDRQYVPALNNLAGVYYLRGEFDKAIELCERNLEINPKEAKSHVNMGRAYFLKGSKKKALRCWHAALAIDPEGPEAKECIAKLGGKR